MVRVERMKPSERPYANLQMRQSAMKRASDSTCLAKPKMRS